MRQEEENRNLVKAIFDEMADGNTQALVNAMADDFRWVFPGTWSWAGSWEPKEHVVEGLLKPLMAQFQGPYTSTAELIMADGDRVVVQTRGRVVTRDGDTYSNTYCFIFTVRDGQLVEVIEHCDTALVERLLRHPSMVA